MTGEVKKMKSGFFKATVWNSKGVVVKSRGGFTSEVEALNFVDSCTSAN